MVTVILAGAVVALAVAVVVLAVRRPAGASPSRELVHVPSASTPTSLVGADHDPTLVVEPIPTGEEAADALAVRLADGLDLFRIDLDPPGPPGGVDETTWTDEAGPLVAVLGPLLSSSSQLSSALAQASTIQVTFSGPTLAKLASGQLKLMSTTKGAVAVAVDGQGRIAELGTVVSGMGGAAAGALVLGVMAGAATVAFQLQVMASLQRLEASVGALLQRSRDGDRGSLLAAVTLVDEVQGALIHGMLPEQMRAELAVAAMRVEEVYFSRSTALARVPDGSEDEGVRRRDLIDAAKAIGGNVDGFGEEVNLAITAALARARIQATRALVIAIGGDGPVASDLLVAARDRLEQDLARLRVQLQAILSIETDLWRTKVGIDDRQLNRLQALIRPLAAQVDATLEAVTGRPALPTPTTLPPPTELPRLPSTSALPAPTELDPPSEMLALPPAETVLELQRFDGSWVGVRS